MNENKPLVLLVEDDARIGPLRRAVMEFAGFDVTLANSVQEAESALRGCPNVNLIVTDINLDASQPHDRSGLYLAQALRHLRPQIPIIGYSGVFEESDIDDGVFDKEYLKGSLGPGQIRDMMSTWFELAKRHQDSADAETFLQDGSLNEEELVLLRNLRENPALPRPSEAARIEIISTWTRFQETFSSRPEIIHDLTPRQFEEFVAELLVNSKYEVILTQASKDNGRDILAYDNSRLGRHLFLVECKKYSADHPVGVSIVRALHGTVVHERATGGMVATTSRFTSGALKYQKSIERQLSLVDLQDLLGWVKSIRQAQ